MIQKRDLTLAAVPHVMFDGWGDATFQAALRDTGADPAMAHALCPRGALDLAVDFHHAGDAAMVSAYQASATEHLKIREKITLAVKLRLQAAADKEAVRRGSSLFAQPQHAAEGASLIWGTADAIWTLIGDTSEDVNWYTKRGTLSAVYGATVLFWLGDDSENAADTWAFLDRRIDNVMQFEKAKAGVRNNKALSGLLAGPLWALGQIKKPTPRDDVPGRVVSRGQG